MIYDVSAQFEEILNKAIERKIENLPISYPCKVKKVQDDGVFVEIETLLVKGDTDIERIVPIMQSPYLTLPIKEGDIGIVLNCSYIFEDIIQDETISENQASIKENGLFFIPLVSKSGFKGKVGETLLSSQDFKSYMKIVPDSIELKTKAINSESDSIELKIGSMSSASFKDNSLTLQANQGSRLTMDDEVSLSSLNTIELKGMTSTLGDILKDLIKILQSLSLAQSTAPGTPIVLPPTYSLDLFNLTAKIGGNFK